MERVAPVGRGDRAWVKALKEEARWQPRTRELIGLLSVRRDVAKAELRLRQPRATADPQLPPGRGRRVRRVVIVLHDGRRNPAFSGETLALDFEH